MSADETRFERFRRHWLRYDLWIPMGFVVIATTLRVVLGH